MLQEGFYNNAGVKTPFRIIGDLLCREFQRSADVEPSIRKYISRPAVKINPQYVLTITSGINPEVTYSFDLKDTIKKIYDFVVDQLENAFVDVKNLSNDVWNDLDITSISKSGFIQVDIRAIKGEMTLSIVGSLYNRGLFYHKDTYDLLTSLRDEKGQVYNDEYDEYTFAGCKFKDKLILSEPIKVSSVSVCMDLRTYLTKAINGLHDGSLTSIQVKKNIEDYIKKL